MVVCHGIKEGMIKDHGEFAVLNRIARKEN